jgi:DNA primase small subunit
MYTEEESKESIFLKQKFSEYYSKNFIELPNIENREFGFGVFKRKIANRNIAFRDANEMNYFLRNNKPLFFSYSNAYYKFPEKRPMENKILFGADLIYEFDADELGLEVEEIDGKQWFEKKHLDEAKKQIFKLIDFLEKDFGFDSKDFSINFSGKAGYHLHIRSELIKNLNKQSRIELVDYLTGSGIYFEKLGYDFEKGIVTKTKGGWVERINSTVKEVLTLSPKELSIITGVQQKKINTLLEKREEVIEGINRGVLFKLEGKKSSEFWKKVFQNAVDKQLSPIDRQTSIDLHKIIRVPNTLHGDTGFLAKTIKLEDLEEFDPFVDSIVFDNTPQRVFIKKAPKFTLKGTSFGPFENEEVEVPLFAAIYLIGKGAELK